MPQLKREPSLWPEFGWIHTNLCELSKGYFAATCQSSSPTCPVTQSGLCGAFIPFMTLRSPNAERELVPGAAGDAERPMSDARQTVAGSPEGK